METRLLLCAVLAAVLGFACVTAEANVINIAQDWGSGLVLTGDTTIPFSFDLSSYDLNATGTTINSAQFTLWFSGVDTNADIPPGSSSGGGDSSIYYYQYSGDLTDVLSLEGPNGSVSLPEGTDSTSLDLAAGSDNFLYLRDGDLSFQLHVRETNSWSYNGTYNSGSHQWGYSVPRQYWQSHWVYVRTGYSTWQWIDQGYYVTYYDYYSYYVNDYTTTYIPAYNGSLTLAGAQLSMDYTPAMPSVPEPVSMLMLGCLGAGIATARKLRHRKV